MSLLRMLMLGANLWVPGSYDHNINETAGVYTVLADLHESRMWPHMSSNRFSN